MKENLKKIFPDSAVLCLRFLKKIWQKIYEQYLISTQARLHRSALERLRKKDGPINVVFLAIFKSVWKYDGLYKLMEKDPRFRPIVLVCPVVNNGAEFMMQTLDECYAEFKERGYNVLCSYDKKTNSYINLRSLNPDIIFYTNPYQHLIDDRYYITKFRDVLTCYVNYGYNTTKYQWSNSLLFHKILWRYFCEEPRLSQLVAIHNKYKTKNYVVSGYPAYDDFMNGPDTGKDWKKSGHKLKRIIWAPHHTIEASNINNTIQFSTFLQYASFMQDMVRKYEDDVQFVFKPHPLLMPKLYKHPDWGKERTDAYFEFWEKGENTNYVLGDYTDLFNSSDALLHDCGSFTTEYLYTQKPVMYLSAFEHESQLNEVGLEAFKCHYLGESENDIEHFITHTVIGGDDPMRSVRTQFFKRVLTPPNNSTASANILNHIITNISKKDYE